MACFCFLNYYIFKKKNDDEFIRQANDPIFRRKNSRPMISLAKLPTLKTEIMVNHEDEQKEMNMFTLERRLQESCPALSPRRKGAITLGNPIPLVKQNFMKLHRFIQNEEELYELDDNEIIDKLSNFTGILNLWYTMSLYERLYNTFNYYYFIFLKWIGT